MRDGRNARCIPERRQRGMDKGRQCSSETALGKRTGILTEIAQYQYADRFRRARDGKAPIPAQLVARFERDRSLGCREFPEDEQPAPPRDKAAAAERTRAPRLLCERRPQ